MAIQMIFCVETNKKADTDSIYIVETLRQFYRIDNKVKINKVYMGAKSRYKSKDVLREVESKIKAFKIGETKVIYCIDTDDYEINPDHEKEFREISAHCQQYGYDLIWFCHEVEEVFIGSRVVDSQKVKKAAEFRKNNRIREIKPERISVPERRSCTSNIMNILDKYLERNNIAPSSEKKVRL